MPATSRAKRFVLFPIVYEAIWGLYKDAESRIWFVENVLDKKITEDDVPKASVFALFRAVVSASQFNSANLVSSACAAPETACYLGFQLFLEGIYLEGVARVLHEAFPGENDIAALSPWPALLPSLHESTKAAKLIVYYAFWAAWEDTFAAWSSQLQGQHCVQFQTLISKISEGGVQFTQFGLEACCTFLDADEPAAGPNLKLLHDVYVTVATHLEDLFATAWDKDLAVAEAVGKLVAEAAHPRFVAIRSKRNKQNEEFTTTAEF